ncbi:MAG: hypothetical protein JWR72_3714 [Flavisolibacter sp.]|jgi:hypothetical protein|nr:hypothetical protein [Flavisolibacter sp.]
MFDLFKQKGDAAAPDVKALRQSLLQFIKDQLKRWEGGEGANIKGLQAFLAPPADERHLYEAALFIDDESKFREEVQRIADDYAIELPPTWTMETLFVEELPAEAVKAKDLPFALHVSTRKQPVLTTQTTAYIQVVNGEADKEKYTLTSTGGKVCIGREKKVQTDEGFMRENTIAFSSASQDKSNKFISRQHAHIEWNKDTGAFFLYPDEGGVPPRNKIKVQAEDGAIIRLQTTKVGHHLAEGDQIVLGETALLKFTYENS